MRRKPEVLILVLIAVLFSFTAAQATAPIAKEIPDIRNASNTAGLTNATLVDLDEYVIDPDDRDVDGLQDSSTLIWSENSTTGDDNVAVTANELQVNVPAQGTPSKGESTFVVTDQDTDQDFAGPVTVKSTELLSAPVVDDFLAIGAAAGSAIPYAWALDASETARVEPGSQPPGGGRLFINHSSGVGETTLYGGSTILNASGQLAPRAPYSDPVSLHGLVFGSGSDASLQSAGLSTDAGLNGSFVTALAGFSEWARVTVTRKYSDGSTDSYTVAIADSLEGTTSDIDGRPETNSDANGLAGSEEFEGITINDFLGNTVAGFNTEFNNGANILTLTSRTAQTTAWDVRGQGTDIPGMEITSIGKPLPTFPGATNGRALHLTFDQQDGQGILAFHKGIPPASYNPGDILTFSMSLYVDLNYDGVNDDEINEGSNGIVAAMALADQLTVSMGTFNYIDFPISQTGYNSQAGINLAGNHNYTNKMTLLHGKWTRHQVSWRVPEIGQSVTGGPGGTGDLIDPTGITAAWTIQRGDTAAPVDQQVWVDNVSITNCPGPLAYALGAIQAPMISAGWSFEIPDGDGATSVFYGANNFPQPDDLDRGAVINGNFSTNAGTASIGFPAGSPATFFRASQNASAGWLDGQSATGGNGASYIGNGGPGVALGFPIGHDDSLVLDNLTTNSFGGVCKVVTPYLDLGLVDQALNPGLHVDTVAFGGGSGSGESNLNQITNNVSGIFGLRFSARADGAAPTNNAAVYAILANSDVTNGLVGQAGSQMLPNTADSVGTGLVWADYFVEGSVVSFHSPQTVEKGVVDGAVTAGALTADNPGRQVAQVQIYRAPHSAASLALAFTQQGTGYEGYLGEVTGGGSAAQIAAIPGTNSSATIFVDEVGLYTVRDTGAYYDEDLTVSSLLP